MERKFNNLSLRFQTKGFAPIEIPGLIKDIFDVLDKGRDFNVTVVNQELEDLGWGIEILDNVTYEIIADRHGNI